MENCRRKTQGALYLQRDNQFLPAMNSAPESRFQSFSLSKTHTHTNMCTDAFIATKQLSVDTHVITHTCLLHYQ